MFVLKRLPQANAWGYLLPPLRGEIRTIVVPLNLVAIPNLLTPRDKPHCGKSSLSPRRRDKQAVDLVASRGLPFTAQPKAPACAGRRIRLGGKQGKRKTDKPGGVACQWFSGRRFVNSSRTIAQSDAAENPIPVTKNRRESSRLWHRMKVN